MLFTFRTECKADRKELINRALKCFAAEELSVKEEDDLLVVQNHAVLFRENFSRFQFIAGARWRLMRSGEDVFDVEYKVDASPFWLMTPFFFVFGVIAHWMVASLLFAILFGIKYLQQRSYFYEILRPERG